MKKRFVSILLCLSVCFSGCASSSPADKVAYLENVAEGNNEIYQKVFNEVNDYAITGEAESRTPEGSVGHGIAGFFKDLNEFNEYSLDYLAEMYTPAANLDNSINESESVSNNDSMAKSEERSSSALLQVRLLRVVDGDTLLVELNQKEEYVRLIGIDTPESVNPDVSKNTPEGTAASEYTHTLLENTTDLWLEFDKEQYDKYGRILAYVWLTEDTDSLDGMLNAVLLENGYAKPLTIYPNTKYAYAFSKIQQN